ncbi:MAG: beta-lactamase [Bacteroidetes bacterium]|nr:MAG: beta-lactamase [Bacteroidota bacterium]
MLRTTVLLVFLFPAALAAQLPKTGDVWLFDYKYTLLSRGYAYAIGAGSNISQNAGYDNQPAFAPSGQYLLYSSDRGDGQTDIYRYDIHEAKTEVFSSQKNTSEYSPTFVPGNKYVSTVTVEKDSAQRLWLYHKETKTKEVVLPKKFGVGYHAWFDERTVFLFLLTEPFTLVMGDIKTGQVKTVADSIGRSMSAYKTNSYPTMLFTVQQSDSSFVIKAANAAGLIDPRFTPIPCLKGSQDFAIDKEGNILMAKGSKIYSWKVGKSTSWEEAMDLTFSGVKNITRLAFDKQGKRLAVVDNKPE